MAIIVTGGSRGIGRAIVLAAAARGEDVAFTFKSGNAAAEETLILAGKETPEARVKAYRPDVTKEEDCVELVKQVEEDLGPLTGLVNNAGINQDGLLIRMSEEQFRNVIDTNLVGAFLMTKAVISGMLKRRGGSIVQMSSVVGEQGNAGQSNYAAAKAGLLGMSKSLAKEVGSRGIRVNVVNPGFVSTEMTDKLPEKLKEQAKSRIVLKRFAEPAEIASAVLFLLSEESSYITGTALDVSGGISL